MGGRVMAVKLTLDGQRLVGNEIKVQITYTIETDDLSGQGSSTADADTGHKAQLIRIRMLISQSNPDNLSTIRQLAGKLDEDGSRHIYTIVNDTAEAMDIRQVAFFGEMAVREDNTLKAWRVTFQLKEHRSVAEKQQEKQDAKTKAEVAQTTTTAQDVPQAEEQPELTGLEQFLAKGESWLSDENT